MYVCILSHVQLFATPWTVRPLGSSDFPGKTTGVGYHFLLQGIFLTQGSNSHLLHRQGGSLPLSHLKVKVLVAQSCLTFCDPRDCGPPGPSVHGILQARILEWVAIPYSSWSSPSRDWTWVSCSGRQILYHLTYQGSTWGTWETLKKDGGLNTHLIEKDYRN